MDKIPSLALYYNTLCPCCGRPFPPSPTQHLPGSDGKIAVMQRRADRGQCLYHPDDALALTNRRSGAKPVRNIEAVLTCR